MNSTLRPDDAYDTSEESYPKKHELATAFIESANDCTKSEIADELTKFRQTEGLYQTDNVYDLGDELNNSEHKRVVFALDIANFYSAVNDVCHNFEARPIKKEGAKACYVLGRDAFVSEGHNKMDIEPSKRGYAALFHH